MEYDRALGARGAAAATRLAVLKDFWIREAILCF